MPHCFNRAVVSVMVVISSTVCTCCCHQWFNHGWQPNTECCKAGKLLVQASFNTATGPVGYHVGDWGKVQPAGGDKPYCCSDTGLAACPT
jgi:hypothetical protein